MSEDDFQTILQGLYDGSQRLTRLVEDFLLLNHLTSGSFAREKQQASHKTTSPGHVIKEIVAGFGSQAAARNVEIIVRPEPAKLAIGVDPWHLEEIVRRIVDNAIKFSKDQEGKVELVTRREGEYWVLAVADDGIGIPQEALSWIFDAFRQVDREKMEQQGSGIGLTIVRGLAEAYGGRVTVESTLGEGSVFAVYLPLATS